MDGMPVLNDGLGLYAGNVKDQEKKAYNRKSACLRAVLELNDRLLMV
jgi:hypothetical protein